MKLPTKVLSKEEAIHKKQILLMQIRNLQEVIIYWHDRRDKPLELIDSFILMSDGGAKNAYDLIEKYTKRINDNLFLINNYCHQFCSQSDGLL